MITWQRPPLQDRTKAQGTFLCGPVRGGPAFGTGFCSSAVRFRDGFLPICAVRLKKYIPAVLAFRPGIMYHGDCGGLYAYGPRDDAARHAWAGHTRIPGHISHIADMPFLCYPHFQCVPPLCQKGGRFRWGIPGAALCCGGACAFRSDEKTESAPRGKPRSAKPDTYGPMAP